MIFKMSLFRLSSEYMNDNFIIVQSVIQGIKILIFLNYVPILFHYSKLSNEICIVCVQFVKFLKKFNSRIMNNLILTAEVL